MTTNPRWPRVGLLAAAAVLVLVAPVWARGGAVREGVVVGRGFDHGRFGLRLGLGLGFYNTYYGGGPYWASPYYYQPVVYSPAVVYSQPVYAGPVYYDPPPTPVWVEPVYGTVNDQVWVEPVYRTVNDKVWVEATTRTVSDRVWVEPVTKMVDEVWVPDRYEDRPVVHFDRGREVVVYEQVLAEAGHWEHKPSTAVVTPGYWKTVERQEPVPAHYETVSRQELVTAGHYETVTRQVVVTPGHFETQ